MDYGSLISCVIYRRMDPDSISLNEMALSENKKSSISDWRSKLASRFKNNNVAGGGSNQYSVVDAASAGNNDTSFSPTYRKTSDELDIAPKTEPPRRRTLNNDSSTGGASSARRGSAAATAARGGRATSVMSDLRPVSVAV